MTARKHPSPPILRATSHAAPRSELRATTFSIDDTEFLVLSYPVVPLRVAEELTRAERDVAAAFARGRSMRDIAGMRGTSTRTVANQIRAIYSKLRVGSRAELSNRLSGAE
jgi:DNA-binding NarL/FixJ family response regulator